MRRKAGPAITCPALGLVARDEKFMWGVFKQNLLSFAGDYVSPAWMVNFTLKFLFPI